MARPIGTPQSTEARLAISKALAGRPRRKRVSISPVIRAFWNGKDIPEIARGMGVSYQALQWRLASRGLNVTELWKLRINTHSQREAFLAALDRGDHYLQALASSGLSLD